MRLVSQLDCRSSETSSILVRGASCRAAHGGQPVSKSGEQRSIRWLGATGMCRRLRVCLASKLTRSVTEHLHSLPFFVHGSRPMVRITAWYAVRAGSIPDGSSSLAVAHLVPVGAKAQRGPGAVTRGSPRAQGGRVSVAAKSNFAREVFPAARFASNEEDSDRSRARALSEPHSGNGG